MMVSSGCRLLLCLLPVLSFQINGLKIEPNVNSTPLCQQCSNGSEVINEDPGWASVARSGRDYCFMVDLKEGAEDCHECNMTWPALCEALDPVCAAGVLYGGKCYSATAETVMWDDAVDECKKQGMSLASVCYAEPHLYKEMKNLYKPNIINEYRDKLWTNGGTTVCTDSSPRPGSPDLDLALSLGLGLPAGLILVMIFVWCYLKKKRADKNIENPSELDKMNSN